MGRVFRARDERLGRAVAVKVLRPESAADPDFRARFAREARTLARLEHPGIVAVHDFGTTAGGRRVSGDAARVGRLARAARLPLPVAGRDRRRPAGVRRARLRARPRRRSPRHQARERAASATTAAPACPTSASRACSSPRADDARPLTRPSLVLGTPGYMAPEARAGAPPDPRADVFAVGALLAHMLTGRHPDGAHCRRELPPRAGARDRARDGDGSRAAHAQRRRAGARAGRRRRAHPRHPRRHATSCRPRSARGAAPSRCWRPCATAVALYAALVSLTPRAMPADDAVPFTAFGDQKLGDGRILTRARFEVWPTLGAAVAIAVALGAYGLLRRHWRVSRPRPPRARPPDRRRAARARHRHR